MEKEGGGFLLFGEGGIFTAKQIAVTYKHEGTWSGYTPEDQSSQFTDFIAKLEKKEPVTVVFYGDSITAGGYSNAGMPKWSNMVTDYLAARYGYDDADKITYVNTSQGGKDTRWALDNLQTNVIDYEPDLLVFAFGMNDYDKTPAQHGAMLEELVTKMQETIPGTEILLVLPFLPNPEAATIDKQQSLFEPELVEVAEAHDNVGYAKVTSMHKQIMAMGKRYYDTTFNNVNHPNDFISRIYTQTVLAAILGEAYTTLDPNADIPATGIEITRSTESLYEGASFDFACELTPFNSTGSVVWSVSAPELAEITQDGAFTALKAGEVTVTATVEGTALSDSVTLTIKSNTLPAGAEKEDFEDAVLGEGQTGSEWQGLRFEGMGMMSFTVNSSAAEIVADGDNKVLQFSDESLVNWSGVTFDLSRLGSEKQTFLVSFKYKIVSGNVERFFIERTGGDSASDHRTVTADGAFHTMSLEMELDLARVSGLKISVSLGDWFEDRKKLPEGLGDLSCQIKKRGLKFGLWFEPEMISEDSDLYRKHPDWAIGCAGRCRMRMRHQLVLDLAREDVRDYLFETLCGIIERAGLDYIKWDMNRYILDMPAADYSYRYTTGLYALLEKITAKYPDLLIEGCAGGGGRFDLGMLYYFPQIWASDNTDAIARLPIQEGTSFLYPLSAIGAHVTAVPNHQVGRVTPFKTRAAVSMFGNFGFELDLNKLSPEETEQAKRAVEFYKTYRSEIVGGEFYRLSAADAEVCAWQVTGERHVFVCAVQGVARAERFYAPLRLRALGGGELYRDLRDGAVYGGDELMRYGFHTGLRQEDFDARFFVFEKVFR